VEGTGGEGHREGLEPPPHYLEEVYASALTLNLALSLN